jgi:hypothetical protein
MADDSGGLLSGVLGGIGSIGSAIGNYNSGQYNAQVARNNKVIAEQNAQLAIQKGNAAIGIARQRTAQTIGAERAGQGASGFDVNSGTSARVQSDTARIGAMDAQTIADNAARSAWGFQTQGANFQAQSSLDAATGTNQAISSLIGGGSNFASKWGKWQQAGVGGGGGSAPPPVGTSYTPDQGSYYFGP